jgi:hypothetical protein
MYRRIATSQQYIYSYVTAPSIEECGVYQPDGGEEFRQRGRVSAAGMRQLAGVATGVREWRRQRAGVAAQACEP